MTTLPNLRVLPTASLIPHEWHDAQRSRPLAESLRASGVLRNPPIVTPFSDGSGRYMVLDGANRSAAALEIGLPHILAQVVEGNDAGLKLKKWNHVLWNWEPASLLTALTRLPGITLREIDPKVKRRQTHWPLKTLIWLQLSDDSAFVVRTEEAGLHERAKQLTAISHLYVGEAQLDRTTAQRVNELDGQYDNLTAVVVYPPFFISEVMELCGDGILLPPGVTRFTVSPRALRVNYPLDELAADKSLDAKNESLQAWVNERTARKGVRFYSEPTMLYDE